MCKYINGICDICGIEEPCIGGACATKGHNHTGRITVVGTPHPKSMGSYFGIPVFADTTQIMKPRDSLSRLYLLDLEDMAKQIFPDLSFELEFIADDEKDLELIDEEDRP